MGTNPLFIIAVISSIIVGAELLARKTFLRYIDTTLLVILLTAIAANLGIIPTTSEKAPIYDGVFAYVAPIAIFLLLLKVNLREVLRAGPRVLLMFAIGAIGTVAGVFAGMWLLDGGVGFGELRAPLAGMYTGTYIGGSVNFNALALHYGVMKEGTLFAGAIAADNIITAFWLLACLGLPRLLPRRRPSSAAARTTGDDAKPVKRVDDETETVHPLHLGLLLGLAALAAWLSNLLADRWNLPSILILTTIALVLAQFEFINRLTGTRLLGMFGLYIFLSVIGAFCDVSALHGIGELGLSLLGLTLAIVLTHGVFVFGLGALFRIDPDITAVASQACIGGPTTALAVARGLGRSELQIPSILAGAVGYAIGTYLGFFVARFLAT